MAYYIGFDGNGIQRVWGEHENADVAETECRRAMLEYCQRRRDIRLDQCKIERQPD